MPLITLVVHIFPSCFVVKQKKKVEKPIYFSSHKLSDTQTKWSTIEKGAYIIHYAHQKVSQYLHNVTFTIYTDQKPPEFAQTK